MWYLLIHQKTLRMMPLAPRVHSKFFNHHYDRIQGTLDYSFQISSFLTRFRTLPYLKGGNPSLSNHLNALLSYLWGLKRGNQLGILDLYFDFDFVIHFTSRIFLYTIFEWWNHNHLLLYHGLSDTIKSLFSENLGRGFLFVKS